MKFAVAAVIAYATMVTAICHNSAACLVGGNGVCDWTCKRQGNPSGGRCLPRDGCPGYDICACYPKKRSNTASNEAVEGDEVLRDLLEPVFQALGDEETDVEKRSEDNAVEKRSVCCSLVPPFKGLCCESHCTYIGKMGGQCSDKDVCVCN